MLHRFEEARAGIERKSHGRQSFGKDGSAAKLDAFTWSTVAGLEEIQRPAVGEVLLDEGAQLLEQACGILLGRAQTGDQVSDAALVRIERT